MSKLVELRVNAGNYYTCIRWTQIKWK
jgi:hypothetical protein